MFLFDNKRLNKVKNPLNFFLNLSRPWRIYIRLLTETLTVATVYYFWLVHLDILQLLSFRIHVFNFVIWLSLYRIFGLQKDRLRYSSLYSYRPVFKLSLSPALPIEFRSEPPTKTVVTPAKVRATGAVLS